MTSIKEKIEKVETREPIEKIPFVAIHVSPPVMDDIYQAMENGFYWREKQDDPKVKAKKDEKKKEVKEVDDEKYASEFHDEEMYDHICIQVFSS